VHRAGLVLPGESARKRQVFLRGGLLIEQR
jgi:hypothetical protein